MAAACSRTPGQVALDLQVGVAVRVVGAQPVAEQQHPADLGRAGGEHVQVDGGVGAVEQPVLESVRLADAQDVAGGLQRWGVGLLVG
jgi:hypothetical protein